MNHRDPVVALFDRRDPARAQQRFARQLGLDRAPPFTGTDVTAGAENELGAAVLGPRAAVDLPNRLPDSPHLESLSPAARAALAEWLAKNPEQVWEHSWLRVARDRLHPNALAQVERDLAGRSDRVDFEVDAERFRLPASYVLKLALIDIAACLPTAFAAIASRTAECFVNDNTAPEILSTHIVSSQAGGLGVAVANENAQRFLLTQLLTAYANEQFDLTATGQTLTVYGAPNPPQRLKQLSRLLPSDYYRELLMNPCLSGFEDGAAKRNYMHLCHATLSRSRQHAHARLTMAGIGRSRVIERLVCDTSLLNNGTHLSLGSRVLGAAFAEPDNAAAEKYFGDLGAKIIEHYLPLFVGLYSGAPARLAANDLKPERALGFLPNEIVGPFLKLTWQSWKRKAGLLASLKGDMVPDARLLDYFAALPSLPGQGALDGQVGNGERLKHQLETQGLYSQNMTVYALYRLREHARMGYSGFEGRHYSLFASFMDDLAPAADLQALITAVAYQALVRGEVTHSHIPDDPETESERRQLFFALAAGLPIAYVRRTTRNRFLLRVLAHTLRTRPSKRHPQFYKVYLDDYRRALVRVLADDAERLLDYGRHPVLADLQARLAHPTERSAVGSLTRGVLNELGAAQPLDVDAGTFNRAAERYYRGTLRTRQLAEGVEACGALMADNTSRRQRECRQALLQALLGATPATQFMAQTRAAVLREAADPATLRAWIGLVLVNVACADPV